VLLPRHALTTCTQKTVSGIFLPTSATNNPLPEATVIAVGPGAPDKHGKIVPTQVQAGDRVLLPGWGGSSIKVGEEVCTRINSFICFPFADVDCVSRSTSFSATVKSLPRSRNE